MGHPTPSAIAVYNANVDRLGLNKPIIIQFFMYMEALFQGQWGTSISLDSGANVWTIIWTAFPHTLELALYSEILAVIIGIRVGVISAVNRNKPKDTTIRIIALVGVSVPVFFLGLLFQYYFGYVLGILPVGGFKTIYLGDPPTITNLRLIDCLLSGQWNLFVDSLEHLILPVFCLTFLEVGFIARYTQSEYARSIRIRLYSNRKSKGLSRKRCY